MRSSFAQVNEEVRAGGNEGHGTAKEPEVELRNQPSLISEISYLRRQLVSEMSENEGEK
jgi:hypothetical protein